MRYLLLLALSLCLLVSPALAQIEALAPGAATESAPSADTQTSINSLIDIIENPTTRDILVQQLRQSAQTPSTEQPDEQVPDLSIARQLAQYTGTIASAAAATTQALGQVAGELQRGLHGTLRADFSALKDLAWGMLLIAAGLFGVLIALRIPVIAIQNRLADRATGRNWRRRFGAAALAALVDGASVLVAWSVGYGVAVGFVGEGRIGITQSLLLNAFLLVEVSKLLLRVMFSPRFDPLRMVPLSSTDAAYWSFWIGRVISLLGYTFMFLAPVLATSVSRSAAKGLEVLVMMAAFMIGVVVVLQCKAGLRARLSRLGTGRSSSYAHLLIVVGQFWHIVAIAYLVTLLLAWLADPDQALPFMVGATVKSGIAILVGMAITSLIARLITLGLQLPADVQQRLPLLESRLHAFVPRVLQVVRLVVIIGVLLAVVHVWGVFDVLGWISSDRGQQALGSLISAGLIVLACIILYIVVASWVEYRLNTGIGKTPTMREKTLLGLFKNAFTIALAIFGTMLALAQIGVNIAPLLAGAGVLGLAIGFGAQKLVQDIITGIFIQFENIMNEGDVVEAAGKSGVVEKLTIRSVTIRDMAGTVHLIPFSSVDQVSNMVRGFSFYVAEFELAYDSDVEVVKQAMRDGFDRVMEVPEYRDVILDHLDLNGIVASTATSLTFRARIKTLAGKQWDAGRYYTQVVSNLLAERGVQRPRSVITYLPEPARTLDRAPATQ